MLIKKPSGISGNEITDERTYFNRRTFLRAGILAASATATGWVYRKLNSPPKGNGPERTLMDIAVATTRPSTQSAAGFVTDEPRTDFQDITHYNNFYEFSLEKEEVADLAARFVARPWQVSVGGLCRKPATFDLDDLLKIAPAEERVYRMRCVEAWSMVIPWDGFSLSKLLGRVQPLSDARYVAFQTLLDPKRLPNQNGGDLPWPYVEGLRMDEAMHPLTILASGIYGKQLPAQDGAPVRLVTPWKYGFKGIKSIVKIELRAQQPPTTWNAVAPNEYGFYANVNPQVDHPRWSQATERRIGVGIRPTLMFNGYADEVGWMYAGMDLRANF
ncbi:MAG: protein-methionine-sulfoxide reductase catalytic subunit MsrP [Tepidisphaeraceae bacterium]